MAYDAGAVVGRVNLETGEFQANIVGAIDKTDKMSKSMLGAQIQFALLEKAIGAVTGFIKSSLGNWEKQEAAMAQTEARLKSTGGAAGVTAEEMFALSGAIQEQTTYADEDVLAMQNLLLTFTNIRGPVVKEATEAVTDMATALNMDLNSAAQLAGRALQDPIRGMTQLRRSGITFTESQKDLVKQFMQTGNVAGAQGVILDELKKKYGGAAAAAKDTFGGAIKSMNNALSDAQEEIGKALAPTITEFINTAIMPAVKWLQKIDATTVKMVVGFGAAVAATFAVGKAIGALSNMLKAGITPLQGLLMGMAAVGAIVTVVNEAMSRARTIHGELAESYMKEYEAIDGQVKSYNELKNKTNLSSQEKKQLIKVESALKTQLGETSAFVQDQSGKWLVNANSVNKYKKERLDLAVRELKAQIVVSTNEAKWARERSAYFKVYEAMTEKARKTGKISAEENAARTALSIKYGFDLLDIDKARLFTMQEEAKTSDTLAQAKGQLNALTTEGVAAALEYKNATDENTKSALHNTFVTDEQLKAEEDLATLRKENSLEFLDDQAREMAALEDRVQIMRNLGATEAEINEYYQKKKAQVAEKYAQKAADAWRDSVQKIEEAMNSVISPISMAWSAIEGVWGQALQNEEIALDNEYEKKKANIEATVLDEEEKAAALAALDEEYDKKKRDMQKKAWALDKASRISSAIMSTAQGVASALAVFPPWVGIALAATVGALGAAQVALIAAEPMPAYAKGGRPEAGDIAVVGENGPEVVQFNRAARVYSNAESERLFGGGTGGINVTFTGDINTPLDYERSLQLFGAQYMAMRRSAA